MSFMTETHFVTETGFLTFSPTATVESTLTITTEYQQTYTATLGQTVTIFPHWPAETSVVTAPLSPTENDLLTVTITEVVIVLQNQLSIPYSTRTMPISSWNPNNPTQSQTSPYLLVVDSEDGAVSGWNSWDTAQRGGLITGVIIAFLLIVTAIMVWLAKRKSVWVANDWCVRSHPDWGVHPPNQVMAYTGPRYGWSHG